jgi:DNA-binding MarR family transcriptional regulator
MQRPDPVRALAGEPDLDEMVAIGWLLNDVHRLLSRVFDEDFKNLGLTRSQWRVMAHLLHRDGLMQRELAEIDAIEKAPMGRLLDKLEETGWITRRPDPEDGRAKRVYRTDKIEPLIPAIKERARAIFESLYEGLSSEERDQLFGMLVRIKDNARARLGGHGDDVMDIDLTGVG